MQISLSQRLKVFGIQFFLNLIWSFDWIVDYPRTILLNFVRFAFAILIISLSYFGFTHIYDAVPVTGISRYLASGVVYNLYGSRSFYESNRAGSSQVLGARSKRVLPILIKKINEPGLTAKAALVVNVENKKILFDLNSNEKLAPASTTKLMTALVALDLYSLDEKIKIPYFCTTIEGQKAGLPNEAEFTVKNLLYSLLVGSAGDAACALSVGKISTYDFVRLMNKKAMELKMYDTSFTNPIGLDDADGSHYSTATDLYILAEHAVKNELIKGIVKTKSYIIKSESDNFAVHIENTNKLLWDVQNTVGIKTGKTQEAGEVLIYEYKDDLRDLIIVVMGSQDRFADTKTLLDWTLNSYSWK